VIQLSWMTTKSGLAMVAVTVVGMAVAGFSEALMAGRSAYSNVLHLEGEILVVDLSFHLHRLPGVGRQLIPAWSRKDICQAVRMNIIWEHRGFCCSSCTTYRGFC